MRTANAKCENSQTAKKMKTVKMQKCENSQNAKMGKQVKRNNVKPQ